LIERSSAGALRDRGKAATLRAAPTIAGGVQLPLSARLGSVRLPSY
jgi:hypothetical protein